MCSIQVFLGILRFPPMGVPKNGRFIVDNPIEMDDDWGYPHDSGNLHLHIYELSRGVGPYLDHSCNNSES